LSARTTCGRWGDRETEITESHRFRFIAPAIPPPVAGNSARAQVRRQAFISQSGISQSSIVCCGARRNPARAPGVLFLSSEPEEAMRDRFIFKATPERLSLFAMALVMIVFGAGIFYEGASFKGQQRTAQLAAADWYP
jgi:hypothetical protein